MTHQTDHQETDDRKVFVSGGGSRYHSLMNCPALANGQSLNDWDCPDDYCSHRGHVYPRRVGGVPLAEAALLWSPCRVCRPPLAPTTEDFGHEPKWFNAGFCGGCPECGGREETLACVRCGVEWPCATVRVLGLEQR